MKKRLFLFCLVGLLLVSMLAVPALASEASTKTETIPSEPIEKPTEPAETKPAEPKPTEPVSTDPAEPTPTEPAEKPTEPVGTTPPVDPNTCDHDWVDTGVSIAPTCKDPGAKGYLCSKCGAIGVEELPKLTTHFYDSPCDPDCNICGATREAEHKPGAGYNYNSTKHWHVCTLCGAKIGEGAHYPGPAATEEEDQICLTCGKVMMTKRSHTHTKETALSSDESGHWYACKGCDEHLDFAPHKLSGTCGTPCADCGYVPEAQHVYGEAWNSDGEAHWQVCTLCGAEGPREPHAMGPGGSTTCPVCGVDPAAEEAHQHVFAEEWMQDATSHWHGCDCGEKADLAIHSWNEGSSNDDSSVTFLCRICGFEKTEAAETEETEAPETAPGFPVGIVLAVIGVLILILLAALLYVLGVFRKPKGHFKR